MITERSFRVSESYFLLERVLSPMIATQDQFTQGKSNQNSNS